MEGKEVSMYVVLCNEFVTKINEDIRKKASPSSSLRFGRRGGVKHFTKARESTNERRS